MADIPHIRRKSRIAAAARRLAGGGTGLQYCVACGSDFVCPIEWEPAGPDHWLITLHCGECAVWRNARVTNAEAKTFDLELDRQTATIKRALADIDRERMRVEVDAFAAALQHDLIDPADFARG